MAAMAPPSAMTQTDRALLGLRVVGLAAGDPAEDAHGGGDSADEGEDLPEVVQELVEESHMGFSLLIRGAARVALAPCLTRRGG